MRANSVLLNCHSTDVPASSLPRPTSDENPAQEVFPHDIRRAMSVVAENNLQVPASRSRFELVVRLAAEAKLLFFNAALHEPAPGELDQFFENFIFQALQTASV
jgi:hypothetical protein